MNVAALLSTMVGALVSIAMVMLVERMRRPRFEFSILEPCDGPWGNTSIRAMRSLRLNLTNKTLSCWASWWMTHTPAHQCRAAITFHDEQTRRDLFGRTMEGRWAASPEPIVFRNEGQSFASIPEQVCVIYPGEAAVLDVAIRVDDDVPSYGWSNESYFCMPPFRNERWQLPQGIYLLKVVVTSSGQKYSRCFS
jgi:hypothetical protein